MQLRNPIRSIRVGGFSLVEVMVALLVISIGLLGIAKMQALALSNTGTARIRALAAIEADSLSGTLQADRNFWSGIAADPAVVVKNGGVDGATADGTLSTQINCSTSNTLPNTPATSSAPCTAHQMAAFDLQQWAIYLQQVMGQAPVNATINCTKATATTPVSCTIGIYWTESEVNANKVEAAGSAAALTKGAYTLVVNP